MNFFRNALLSIAVAGIMAISGTTGTAFAAKPTVLAPCNQCHKVEPDIVRGTLVSVSEKFKSISVQVGQKLVWVINYGDDLKLNGAEKLATIPKGKEIGVKFTGEEKKPYAVSLFVKPPAKIPADKLAKVEDVQKLISVSPDKGGYLLVDSRPKARYNEGHIPFAVSLPTDKFDNLKDNILPKEKDKLIVFYCGGLSCQLSPTAMRKAEAAGYTNVKVFHEGIPGWKKGGNLVVAEPAALKDMKEKDIAHVLIDIRDVKEAEKGFIPGAVTIPAKNIASSKDNFPADKSAPIFLYGDKIDAEAYKAVRSMGYTNTAVLNGGIEAWTKEGGKLQKGKLSTTISYAPKPRPGEISIEEFKAIAEKGSPDKIILDVRDTDEAMNGMIKGAINIPASQITERIKELPKDKEIITHCVTGIRAESAYEDIKEAGYKVRFLNALIQIDKDGRYEITKK